MFEDIRLVLSINENNKQNISLVNLITSASQKFKIHSELTLQ